MDNCGSGDGIAPYCETKAPTYHFKGGYAGNYGSGTLFAGIRADSL